MTALHQLTGWPVGRVRTVIEMSVLISGCALFGTLGIGTLAFALTVGPSVAAMLRLTTSRSLFEL